MARPPPTPVEEGFSAPPCAAGGHKFLTNGPMLEAAVAYLRGRAVFHVPAIRIHCAACGTLNVFDATAGPPKAHPVRRPRVALRA